MTVLAMDGKRLLDQEVAFTGRLASMTRAEVTELIVAQGGRCVRTPTRQTDLLVVGEEGWPLGENGQLSRQLQKARRLQAEGAALEVIPESVLLERLGLEDQQAEIHRRYTASQLARILRVPLDRIRLWMRSGLITPLETRHRLGYFDFSQVASAKTLSELTRAGVKANRIRTSLHQLRAWMPDLEQPLGQLALLERNGRLLVRLEDGQLAEPTGQLQFEFMNLNEPRAVRFEPRPLSADEWFNVAVQHEEAGRLADASDAYRQALLLTGPDPVLCFNLGNVLYAQGETQRSAERFRQAVEIDVQYTEAWNNLGSVLSELGETAAAIEAFQKALALDPSYADAHYRLADTLDHEGRVEEATPHWRAYLTFDARSPWADHVRKRLAEVRGRS